MLPRGSIFLYFLLFGIIAVAAAVAKAAGTDAVAVPVRYLPSVVPVELLWLLLLSAGIPWVVVRAVHRYLLGCVGTPGIRTGVKLRRNEQASDKIGWQDV